jgi:methionyl-tRNA formyltransferase
MEIKPFWSAADVICIAGKNQIAVDGLEHLLDIGVPPRQLCVIGNREDKGKNTWQPSLLFAAARRGVRVATLESLYAEPDLWFFSLEYDRLIKPALFSSRRLYNIHFSLLPAYRGVCTSIWPILKKEKHTGVTFHEIDEGIDTGPILRSRKFEIESGWTARDLYFAYQDNAAALFRDVMRELGSGSLRPAPQSEENASLYLRKDINFADIHINLSASAADIHDQLRAFTFWEYQLPSIGGREVWRSRLLGGRPSAAEGSIKFLDRWNAIVSGVDGDVEVLFSPYEELFSWARGDAGVSAPEWSSIPDINLMNAKGWSALMVAAYHGNEGATRLLIEAGASAEAANLRGTTPLMYAFARMTQTGDTAVFSYLLSIGANPERRDASGLNINDYVPSEKRGDLHGLFPNIFS